MPKDKQKLIACLNIRDEDWVIEYCLTNLSTFVNEIVIVDDGSTDRTLEIVKKFPKVVEVYVNRKKDPDYRTEVKDWNRLIAMAGKHQPDWLLFLDADEMFSPDAEEALPKLMATDGVGEYRFTKYNFWQDTSHYRADRPKDFQPAGDILLNPILVRYQPGLKWYLYSKLPLVRTAKSILGMERFLSPEVGRSGLKGVRGVRKHVETPTALHFGHLNREKRLKTQLFYTYWQVQSTPRKRFAEIYTMMTKKLDESTLELTTVPKIWLWGNENLIRYREAMKTN